MDEPEILFSTPMGDGSASVVRRDGYVSVTPDVAVSYAGSIVGRDGWTKTKGHGGTVVGGPVAGGAIGARVRDAGGSEQPVVSGPGGWVAFVPQDVDADVFVCRLDAAGAPVPPAIPETWERTPVTDAPEPCPACDGVAWEIVTADDDSRGSSGGEPTPHVSCARCGFEAGPIGPWAVLELASDAEWDPEEHARAMEAWRRQQREEDREALRETQFDVLAPEGLDVELGGWGSDDGDVIDHVQLRHESPSGTSLEVACTVGWDGRTMHDVQRDVSRDLRLMLEPPHQRPEPERSAAARRVWWTVDEQPRLASLAGAVEQEHGPGSVRIDGEAQPVALARAGDRWVAAGQVGALFVRVVANGVALQDTHLRTLADPLHVLGEAPGERFRPLRAARDLLDVEVVRRFARAVGLDDDADAIAGLARPAFALAADDGPGGAAACRIGGEPELPAGVEWPRDGGVPAAFVGQIALADLDTTIWPGPRDGLLSIFCALDEYFVPMTNTATVLVSDASAQLRPCAVPADLPAEQRFEAVPARPTVVLSLPGWGAMGTALPELDGEHEALFALADRLALDQGVSARGQVLGWPDDVHDDVMAFLADAGGDDDPDDWSLLLEARPTEDVKLSFGLRTTDLARGVFDRVAVIGDF